MSQIDFPQGEDEFFPLHIGAKEADMASAIIIGRVVVISLALAGCVSKAPPRVVGTPPANKVWARADGVRMSSNPALMRQGQADLAQCRALANVGVQDGQYDLKILNGCMTSRGYVERDI